MPSIPLIVITVLLAAAGAQKERVDQQLKAQQREACIWIFKKHLLQNGQDIEAQKNTFPEKKQQKFMDKLLLRAVSNCEQLYTEPSQVQSFVDNYREKWDVYSFEMFNRIETATIDMGEKPKKEQKKPILQAEEEHEPYIMFGYDLKRLPKSFKWYYLAGYTVIVGLALYHGIKDVEMPKPRTKQD